MNVCVGLIVYTEVWLSDACEKELVLRTWNSYVQRIGPLPAIAVDRLITDFSPGSEPIKNRDEISAVLPTVCKSVSVYSIQSRWARIRFCRKGIYWLRATARGVPITCRKESTIGPQQRLAAIHSVQSHALSSKQSKCRVACLPCATAAQGARDISSLHFCDCCALRFVLAFHQCPPVLNRPTMWHVRRVNVFGNKIDV